MVQHSGSSSLMVKLCFRLGYNTHPLRASHNIEKAKNGQILKIKRPIIEKSGQILKIKRPNSENEAVKLRKQKRPNSENKAAKF